VLDPVGDRAACPRPHRCERLVFDLDAERIEKGLRERLAEKDLGDLERLRYTSALAGWALAKGDQPLALSLGLSTLDQAAKMDDPRELVAAWYGVGNTMYQCQAYEEAAGAYTECTERAFDCNHALLGAQGLMGLGHTWLVRSDPARADECYVAGHALFVKLGLPHFEAYALTWRGEAARARSQLRQARGLFEEAIAVCDRMDASYASTTRSTKADVLLRLASLYEAGGLHEPAHAHRRQAEELGACAAPCPHP